MSRYPRTGLSYNELIMQKHRRGRKRVKEQEKKDKKDDLTEDNENE